MTTLLPQLDLDMGDLAHDVRKSLVQVFAGRGGSGSGVVLSNEGLIVTNAHVVSRKRDSGSGNRTLQVKFADESVAAAKLLAKDDDLDVAVLQIADYADQAGQADYPLELHPIVIGDSEGLRAGQWVMAMGHPWGVSGAAAAGIVIGSGLDLPESPSIGEEWIAMDLALRPGYSGGPLVDHQGRLIGINTMMAGLEVGLAVPAHVVKKFVDKIGVDNLTDKKKTDFA